ncbi:PilW family protein [Undibacterium arcticum]|uniref:PilW family protein n=1 Tax=Undibacterium arcticum TaxID=1762892 RepID=A0ABV7FC86_9BURK
MNASNHKKYNAAGIGNAINLHRHAGLTLVELMISITIGLLLLAGLTTLFAKQSSARSELDKTGRQIENGRYAMQQLQDDIQLAGYYGEYWRLGALPATLPDPCATATPALVTGIPLPIQGYDSPATVPSPLSGCLPDANHLAGTDILVIRRVDTTSVPIASAVAAQPYLQAGLLAPAPEFTYVLGTGTDTTVFNLTKRDGTPANLRKYLTDIYFVSPCSVPTGAGSTCTRSDDNGKPIPTLKRLELSLSGGAATFTTVPLVEGIENLQLDYGVDYTGAVAADGAPDCYVSDPTTPSTTEITACPSTAATYFAKVTTTAVTNWSNVMAIRVNLLARNNDATGGFIDDKTYKLGLAGDVTPTDKTYKRHVFTQLVRAVNPSSRREQ